MVISNPAAKQKGNGRIFFSSDKTHILSLPSLVFMTYLRNMDIIITKKILLQAISELQSKKKGQHLDNIRHFFEENYQWFNSKTDEFLTSCINVSILRKVVTNGKDSYKKTLIWMTSKLHRAMST